MESTKWDDFGWRWDLNLCQRSHTNISTSPATSPYCMIMTKDWYDEVGGFDKNMQFGGGENIELSLRNWLFGGDVIIDKESEIASQISIDTNPNTISNLARIAEVWFEHHCSKFYEERQLDPMSINCGRLDNLLQLEGKKQRSIDWFVNNVQVELGKIYELKKSAHGKRVAVLGVGPSVDYISRNELNRFDIVIGVDYSSLLFECDYVVTDMVHVLSKMRERYADNKFVLPTQLGNISASRWDDAVTVASDSIIFDIGRVGEPASRLSPPFLNFENPSLSAVHLALFMEPVSVTLFGYDHRLLAGKSHTSLIEYYDGGEVWMESENTNRRFEYFESGMRSLASLALRHNIPLMRVSHA